VIRRPSRTGIALIDLGPGEEHVASLPARREHAVAVLAGTCELEADEGSIPLSVGDVVYMPRALRNDGRGLARLFVVSADGGPGGETRIVRRGDVPATQLRRELGFDRVHSTLSITAERTGSRRLLLGFARFERDGAHALHRHRTADEVVYVIDGDRCQHLTADQAVPVDSGELLFVEAGEWHGFRNAGAREAQIVFAYVGAATPGAEGYELFAG
jgi:quercetin dioxygenase-like cupin family protein